MRFFSALALALSFGCLSSVAQVDRADDIWDQAFVTISPSEGHDQLILVVITNDDPFRRLDEQEAGDEQRPEASPLTLWCEPLIVDAVNDAGSIRPQLSSTLRLQKLAAGLPLELTSASKSRDPARAVTAVCDSDYRLLALAVGVPDGDELLTLVEDAEEVRRWMQFDEGRQAKEAAEAAQRVTLSERIEQRCRDRTHRLWQMAIDEVTTLIADNPNPVALTDSKAAVDHLAVAALYDTLQPTYLTDARLKFGLSDVGDLRRLMVLEQHVEARRDWCEVAMVGLVGSNFSSRWRPLLTRLWNHLPIVDQPPDEELLAWYDRESELGPIVLTIESSFDRFDIWPPADGATRGMTWKEVHDLALEFPHRQLDLQELASLIRHRNLPAIDLRGTSPVRYLMSTPNRPRPTLVRESDPPGRFASLLKRSRQHPLVP